MSDERRCGACGYEGPVYGTPIIGGKKSGVSAPWCPQCGVNNKLEPLEKVKEEPKKRRHPRDEAQKIVLKIWDKIRMGEAAKFTHPYDLTDIEDAIVDAILADYEIRRD